MKRILYFSCRGLSKTAADSLNTSLNNTSSALHDRSEEEEEEEEDMTRYGMANGMDL